MLAVEERQGENKEWRSSQAVVVDVQSEERGGVSPAPHDKFSGLDGEKRASSSQPRRVFWVYLMKKLQHSASLTIIRTRIRVWFSRSFFFLCSGGSDLIGSDLIVRGVCHPFHRLLASPETTPPMGVHRRDHLGFVRRGDKRGSSVLETTSKTAPASLLSCESWVFRAEACSQPTLRKRVEGREVRRRCSTEAGQGREADATKITREAASLSPSPNAQNKNVPSHVYHTYVYPTTANRRQTK